MHVVLASVWVMQYFHNEWYISGDTMLEAEMLRKPREKNVQFLQCKSTPSLMEFRGFRILGAHTLRGIAFGKELLVQHVNKYEFYV